MTEPLKQHPDDIPGAKFTNAEIRPKPHPSQERKQELLTASFDGLKEASKAKNLLFSEEGLDKRQSYWKKRIDRAFLDAVRVLREVQEELAKWER